MQVEALLLLERVLALDAVQGGRVEVVDDGDGVLRLEGRRQRLEDPLDRLEEDGRHDDVDRALELDDQRRLRRVAVVVQQRPFVDVVLSRRERIKIVLTFFLYEQLNELSR